MSFQCFHPPCILAFSIILMRQPHEQCTSKDPPPLGWCVAKDPPYPQGTVVQGLPRWPRAVLFTIVVGVSTMGVLRERECGMSPGSHSDLVLQSAIMNMHLSRILAFRYSQLSGFIKGEIVGVQWFPGAENAIPFLQSSCPARKIRKSSALPAPLVWPRQFLPVCRQV